VSECILSTIGKKVGIKALKEVAMIVKSDTILTWYRKLIAAKFDSSKKRKKKVRRPLTDCELETLILQISKRNPRWGYDRIAGVLANLGYHISDQTVGNILKRNGIMPSPPRKPKFSWSDYCYA
jgi:putative transposase